MKRWSQNNKSIINNPNNPKSPSQLQIERVYLQKNTNILKNDRITAANLLERSCKKPGQRNKISYSASMRRIDRDKNFLIQNWKWNGFLDPIRNLRRENEIIENKNSILENSLLITLQSYKDKEKRWIDEKNRMKNEMLWLKEELNAIREFILSEKSFPSNGKDLSKYIPTPIPAFIRAWHTQLDDEADISQADVKSNFVQSSSQDRKLMQTSKVKAITGFATPDTQVNNRMSSHYFYPGTSEGNSSLFVQSSENLNKLVSNNTKAESIGNFINEAQVQPNLRQNFNIISRVTKDSFEKKGNENSISSLNTRKQQFKSYAKIGSTNDASTLNYD